MNRTLTSTLTWITLSAFICVSVFLLPVSVKAADGSPDITKECAIDAAADALAGVVSDGIDLIGTGIGLGLDAIGLGSVGSFLGLGGNDEKPMKDKETRKNTKVGTVKACVNALKDVAFKVALAKMKKRLLDRITDDTIEWINGGFSGSPKWYSNFGDTFEDVKQAAIGDTMREIGLGKLCNEKLSLKLQLNLRQPRSKPFSENVSCTLNDVVNNVNAFGDDFRNGGWIGYSETLAPQNNRYGLEILAMDQYLNAQTQKSNEEQAAIASGNGYKGVKACLTWRIDYISPGTTFVPDPYEFMPDEGSPYRDPQKKFSAQELVSLFAGKNKGGGIPVSATCSWTDITMPAQLVKAYADQTTKTDTDAIANADDLTPYISAIFDAAINRVIKMGVEGIKSKSADLFSGSGRGQDPEPLTVNRPTNTGDSATDEQNKKQNERDAIYQGYGNQYNNSTNFKETLRKQASADLLTAQNSLSDLSTLIPTLITRVTAVSSSTQALSACETIKLGSNPEYASSTICFTTSRAVSGLSSLRTGLEEQKQKIAALQDTLSKVQAPSTSLTEGELISLAASINSLNTSIENVKTVISSAKSALTTLESDVNSSLTMCQAATNGYKCSLEI